MPGIKIPILPNNGELLKFGGAHSTPLPTAGLPGEGEDALIVALPVPLLFRFLLRFLSFSGLFVLGLGLGVGPRVVGFVGALALFGICTSSLSRVVFFGSESA